jgi:hypothetical protein
MLDAKVTHGPRRRSNIQRIPRCHEHYAEIVEIASHNSRKQIQKHRFENPDSKTVIPKQPFYGALPPPTHSGIACDFRPCGASNQQC